MDFNIKKMPVLPLRGTVLFPHMGINFDIGRDFSKNAIEASMSGDRWIFVTAQKNAETEAPTGGEIYKTGCAAKIKQTLKTPTGVLRVVAEGVCRAKIREFMPGGTYMSAVCELIEEKEPENDSMLLDEGFMRAAEEALSNYLKFKKNINPEAAMEAARMGGVGVFADAVAGNTDLKTEDKQDILEELDPYVRVEKLLGKMCREMRINEIMHDITKKVKKNMDDNQRDYYLREELKVIKKELGDDASAEAEELRKKAKESDMPKKSLEKILDDIDRLEGVPQTTPENAVLRNYLDTVLSLPWSEETADECDLKKAEEILDEDHYGLDTVKERILEYLAVRKLTLAKEGTVICLVGPPGTGKTSIAKSLARATNREYVRISLGGVHDEADIRGHRKTYVGAMPGRIIEAVRKANVKNPLILFDETDKMGADFKGDPAAALLEVLDIEQNKEFCDHYIEVPFDLSKVMFVMTANTLSTIPEPLLDRIEVIEISGYTDVEKLEIAKKYLLPKQLKKHGLTASKASVSDGALKEIIDYYTRESGVRGLERAIGKLLRKSARLIADGERKSVKIGGKSVEKYLGKRKYLFDKAEERDEVGVVRGLAWTSVGGETLSVEVNVMKGNGKVELTGKLGDVMKESALAAVSYIRSKADELSIKSDFYKDTDIHIHVPEGAVPKDGPSAGITIATAVASALTNTPVRKNVAMTGEITLRGKVLPIGGLKEKSLAAYRAGIDTVIIPEKNRPDIDEIPETVREKMNFVPVSNMEQVLSRALTGSPIEN